jgi:hypothetical protein
MCGTAGRYAPGAKSLVVQYQAMFQDATAKGLSPEEVRAAQPYPRPEDVEHQPRSSQ